MSEQFFKSLSSLDFVQNIRKVSMGQTSSDLLNQQIIGELTTDEEFSKAYPSEQYILLTQEELDLFKSDLQAEFHSLESEVDKLSLIEKAKKDLSKLQKVTKTDKNGKRITVYVAMKQATSNKEFNPNAVVLGNKLSKENVDEVAKHYDKLSHINRIKFERTFEQLKGKKFDRETQYGEGTSSTGKKVGEFLTKKVKIPQHVIDSNNNKRDRDKSGDSLKEKIDIARGGADGIRALLAKERRERFGGKPNGGVPESAKTNTKKVPNKELLTSWDNKTLETTLKDLKSRLDDYSSEEIKEKNKEYKALKSKVADLIAEKTRRKKN